MAVKKSELYSLLWDACNKLRGGVEPSRYKDYVLVLLFFKYVSDRYKGQRFAEFTVNEGASFDDLIAAKGKSDVGERVDKIIQKFLEENRLQGSLPDVSFNNPDELGSGKELVDKVSGLIAIFQNPAIDFKSNRASGDDIIGDAYEYFMMKFAQESGKSKGQFYTPSEVSRIIARLIGIGDIKQETACLLIVVTILSEFSTMNMKIYAVKSARLLSKNQSGLMPLLQFALMVCPLRNMPQWLVIQITTSLRN